MLTLAPLYRTMNVSIQVQYRACGSYSRNLLRRIDKFEGCGGSHQNLPLCVQETTLVRRVHQTTSRWDHVVIKTPGFAESISEGDVKWAKALGDYVNTGDVIGEIETDKTSLAVVSSCPGRIIEFIASNDSTVTPGDELVRIDSSVSPLQPKLSPLPEPSPTIGGQTSPLPEPSPILRDRSSPLPETPHLPQDASPAVVASQSCRSETKVKMTRMRKRIGERLKASQNTYAMLTTFNEVDMTNVIAMRKRYGELAQKTENVRLGFLSAFVVAAAHSLFSMPLVNATIMGDEIVYRDYVDISIAVSSPKGLVVPVLRDVGGLSFVEVERKIVELSIKARDGSLSVDEMDGGTFTISNGGVFGSLLSTPILNPPQSAILGLHAIKDRPVAVEGRVEIRPMMYLALTYDHRLIDGRESVTFLKSVKDAVEDPIRLIVGL